MNTKRIEILAAKCNLLERFILRLRMRDSYLSCVEPSMSDIELDIAATNLIKYGLVDLIAKEK